MKSTLAVATLIVGATSCCCGDVFDRLASLAVPEEATAPTDSPKDVMAAPMVPAAPPTDIATGPLTAEAILASDGAVRTFQPWAGALAEMQHRLGKPTRIDGDRFGWAVLDGPDCVGTFMMHVSGPSTEGSPPVEQVGKYMGGQRLAGPGGDWDTYFADCAKDAGVAK